MSIILSRTRQPSNDAVEKLDDLFRVLCSDKTGTLTQNKLTLGDPLVFGAGNVQETILAGALASSKEDCDAIGREISRKLGLGEDIQPATQRFKKDSNIEHLDAEAVAKIEMFFVVYPFGLITPIHWRAVGVIWIYYISWLFMGDWAKLVVLRHLELSSPRHVRFLQLVKKRPNHIRHPS